ncbi:hypothetical protein [Xanthomonas euvesicatoria]|uniref:hypothetical protein n=1 Tax=Xanthomonas euvesicatoria TaxID=456327 RepID=UPI003A1013C5
MSLSDHEPRTQYGKVLGERCWFAEVVCGITNDWRWRRRALGCLGMENRKREGA